MKVGIVGRIGGTVNASSQDISASIQNFIQCLINEGIEPIIESQTALNFLPNVDIQNYYILELSTKVDMIVVFGGDGTMLDVVRSVVYEGIPVIGVNHGRVGFITVLGHDECLSDIVQMLKNRHYTIQPRTLINHDVQTSSPRPALNEIVINRIDGRIIEFNVFLNNVFAFASRSDGVLISTPTGSTAYALSAGGAIIHPESKVLEIATMMPQSLSYRPLVVNDDVEIKIEMTRGEAMIFSDGEFTGKLVPGDALSIKKFALSAKFMIPNKCSELHCSGYDYYAGLREKLYWNNLPGVNHNN